MSQLNWHVLYDYIFSIVSCNMWALMCLCNVSHSSTSVPFHTIKIHSNPHLFHTFLLMHLKNDVSALYLHILLQSRLPPVWKQWVWKYVSTGLVYAVFLCIHAVIIIFVTAYWKVYWLGVGHTCLFLFACIYKLFDNWL